MEVLEAIRQRRTIKRFKPEQPPREAIEQILEAAVWAPNHRLTEPWEFFVISGDALQQVAELRGQAVAGTLNGASEEIRAAKVEEARQKALVAPMSIVVTVRQDPNAIKREEDFAATSAGVQNMLLAITGLGLAAYWATGILVSYQPFHDFLGLKPDQKIVGIVQVGYGAEERQQKRTPAAERTHWLN